MNTMTKYIFVALALALGSLAPPAFADGGADDFDCHDPKNVKIKNAAKQRYEDMLAHDKAGRTKQAYDSANTIAGSCISRDEQEVKRIDAAVLGVRKKSSLKLGEQAESKGKFTEAYEYFSEYYHGIAADRVQMKLTTAKPGDFKAVQTGINYFRDKQKYLNEYLPKNTNDGRARLNARHGFSGNDIAWAMDPDRDARLKAIAGYLGKLQAIATKEGEKYLAEEEKIFNLPKALGGRSGSPEELEKAQDWLGLFGQEKRVNDRAVKRGDTLLADDSRKSLALAISYYGLSRHDSDKNVRKVQDKARRLGDAHLKKGEKQIAADYYNLAGLSNKASEIRKANEAEEAEQEKAETKRQGQFKKGQSDLEKELGL